MTRPWNFNSHVTTCPTCEGAGAVHAGRQAITNDPYPETPCECGIGPHEPECAVCGCTTEVDGYDCIVCDLIDNIPLAKLNDATLADLAKAMTVAMQARRSAERHAA